MKVIGKLIGDGGTAKVYEYGDNEVIKIFKNHVSDYAIDKEESINLTLNNLMLFNPLYKGKIIYNNKTALIYEKAEGKLLADFLFEDLENDYSYIFANIHYSIHQNKIDGLPVQKNIYKWYIDKTNESMENIAFNMNDLLQTLTDDYTLCHGDFHPLNVIVDNKTDKYSIIDWNGANIGSYILDVGWTYLTMISPYINNVYGEEVYNIVKIFSENYLKHYCNFKKIDKEIIIRYLPLVATRRLFDNYQNNLEVNLYEKDWLQTIIKKG
ncbi:phosphotransferase [Mycoplasmatota bacterium]|nr:phosphotransferase [Mycoplasmatota bacterium]